MDQLTKLLASISSCHSCKLMDQNKELNIPYIPILPKPNAKFIFIGRDPSPRTAKIVGKLGGRSVFINEISKIIKEAKISEEHIYITDLCKCHWRTSRGKPLTGTNNRTTKLPADIAEICLKQWLVEHYNS